MAYLRVWTFVLAVMAGACTIAWFGAALIYWLTGSAVVTLLLVALLAALWALWMSKLLLRSRQ